METQKIVNLLNGSEKMKTQNLQQENGMLLTMSRKKLFTQWWN